MSEAVQGTVTFFSEFLAMDYIYEFHLKSDVNLKEDSLSVQPFIMTGVN